jgi:tetratricopeptide (TPR) repeat protein
MVTIKNINEYLEEIAKISSKNQISRFIFRGQTQVAQNVESSAARRIRNSFKEDFVIIDSFIKYHEKLIEIAKMKGYHRKERVELKDLELIAELQHFSAATCFIDFSRNPLIALWFAVNNNFDIDGAIYLLDIKDPQKISQVTYDDIEKKSIREFLSELKVEGMRPPSNVWYWEPSTFNLRIPKQHSIFVFGPPQISNDYLQVIYVAKDSKKKILEDLEKIYDINEISLFSDLPGFARANSSYTIFHEWDGNDYLLYGISYIQKKEYTKAIEYLTESINSDPNNFGAYSLRGISYFNRFSVKNISQHESLLNSALDDFNKAIGIAPDNIQPYLGKGMVFLLLNKFEEAIEEFKRVLQLNPKCAIAYLQRGLAYRSINKFDEATSDFSNAIKFEPNEMTHYHTRGITYLLMEQSKLALDDFNKAIDIDPTNSQFYKSRAIAENKLGLFKEAQFDENMVNILSKSTD